MPSDNDPRRYRVIETRFRSNPARYDLFIDGVLWSDVEWSAKRRAWCIQDAAGRCLAHVDHIHAQDVDAGAAVRLAKRMVRDGRMPTPEQALAAWRSAPSRKRSIHPRRKVECRRSRCGECHIALDRASRPAAG